MTKYTFLLGFFVFSVLANPKPQMNVALRALEELLPFISREEKFLDKKNEKEIAASLSQLERTFGNLKHDQLLKNDLFAPSYAVIKQNISESNKAFREGNKDYAHWRLSEITHQCLDCHTRLPETFRSTFQEKKLTLNPAKFDSKFDLGMAQLIVRDYPAAEKSFMSVIEESMKTKNYMDTDEAFKNLLLIRTKIHPDFKKMLQVTGQYSHNKDLPMDIQEELSSWEKRLKEVEKIKILQGALKEDKDVKTLISTFLEPAKEKDDVFLDNYDVYLLTSSGLLSRYLFTHPQTELAPEISYWLGWTEKVLKRDEYFNSGDLFFKQCIRRYPKSPVAEKCFKELKESTEFEFSGSAGENIPADVKRELAELEGLLKKS
jgi:hypothetical protein